MPTFGVVSEARLETVHFDLVCILNEAIRTVDFTVLDGYRNEHEQAYLYSKGRTKLLFPNSKHNQNPSLAVDIAPWFKNPPHVRWSRHKEFIYLAGVIKGVAAMKDIPIRWGGDWDNDFDLQDNRFNDLVHFELVGY